MEEKYLEVLSKNILNELKNNLKHNNIYLEKDKEVETDKKMLEIIRSIVLNGKYNIFEEKCNEKDKKKEINSNIMPSLMQYYVALYNDNLDLLHKLLDNKFYFGNYEDWEMNLFVLDKRISSKFDAEEYMKLLDNNLKLFKRFYFSLNYNSDNKEVDLNQIIEKFCDVIKKDNNIAMLNQTDNKRVDDLLSVDFLKNFQVEEILNLNDKQKYILERFEDRKDNETKIKLKFIKEYNFSKNLIYWEKFTKFFTDTDILNLSSEDIDLIIRIFGTSDYLYNTEELEEIAINKFKDIKRINPDFNIVLDCLPYDVLSIKQILTITETCAKKINVLCFNTKLKLGILDNNDEKKLKGLIMELYCKDIIKRNIKKLIKIKK